LLFPALQVFVGHLIKGFCLGALAMGKPPLYMLCPLKCPTGTVNKTKASDLIERISILKILA